MHGRPQKFFQRGQRQQCAYSLQVAGDAIQMYVHKTPYPFYITKKMTTLRQQSKMPFVDGNNQVYYDNSHKRLFADFQSKVLRFEEELTWSLTKEAFP